MVRRACGAGRSSVLEEQLPILRQRPEIVGDERLELVDDRAQRFLGRDDRRRKGLGLGLDGPGLVGLVLGVLERLDGVDQRIGQTGDPLTDGADPASTTDAAASWPRYRAAAGRIIVEAMSTAQLASMSTILT